MTYAIETVGLTKEYPQHRGYSELLLHPLRKKSFTALKNISLQLRHGELFCLLGSNGAGKTTLIKILCSLVLPTSGKAFVDGFDVVKQGGEVRKKIGYVVSDERSFYWRLTGRQNLQFFATLHKMPSSIIPEKINRLLDMTGLQPDADKLFKDYSSGMKQKLAIARGLLNDPEMVFMDEPTRSLDPYTSHILRNFIKEKVVGENGKTVFLATHNLQEAETLSDKVAIIHKGQFRAFGTMQEILQNGKTRPVFAVSLARPTPEVLSRLKESLFSIEFIRDNVELPLNGTPFEFEISGSENEIPKMIRMIVEAGGDVLSCAPKKISLEHVFANFIQEGK